MEVGDEVIHTHVSITMSISISISTIAIISPCIGAGVAKTRSMQITRTYRGDVAFPWRSRLKHPQHWSYYALTCLAGSTIWNKTRLSSRLCCQTCSRYLSVVPVGVFRVRDG